MTINNFTLSGRILKINGNSVVLDVCTLTILHYYPSIIIFDNPEEKLKDIKIGDNVIVKGYLSTRLPDVNHPNYDTQRLIASEIVKKEDEQNEMETDTNFIEVYGKIVKMDMNRMNVITLTIRTSVNGRICLTDYNLGTKNNDTFIKTIHLGDDIYMRGLIQTIQKQEKSSKKDIAEPSKPPKTHKKHIFLLYETVENAQ